jgi:diaminopimelate decarboxylase
MKDEVVVGRMLRQKILELAASVNEPFYVYDTEKIRQNCRKFLNIPYFPSAVHFAMMANSNPHFIKVIKDAGLKLFVNSLLHLEIALSLGFNGDEVIYAASAMDESAMKKVQTSGANLILDSIGQLTLWQSLFPDKGIGIRCNIGEVVVPKRTTGGFFIGNESRLGMTIEAIKSLEGDPSIEGLHIYVGTNISEIDYFLDCYKHIITLAALFPKLKYLDFGGGFGIGEKTSVKFDVKSFGMKITSLMSDISAKLGQEIKLMLEPGRIIGADAGYFVCRITDIKRVNNRQLIGVNASCVQFPRPLFYPESAWHPVSIISSNGFSKNESTMLSSVYGCSTYSRDYLARDTDLPCGHIGDTVIFGLAGSYCASAHTDFLGFPKAEEYFL